MLSCSTQVGWEREVPVLHAVLHHPVVKRVVKLAVKVLDVTVATRVGLLIGSHVRDDHLKLITHTKNNNKQNENCVFYNSH